MAYARLPRRGSIATYGEAAAWLRSNPFLFVLAFGLGLVEALGEFVALFPLLAFFLTILFGGIVYVFAVGEAFDPPTELEDATSQVAGRYVTLVVMTIIYIVVVAIGLVLFILPGIYFALRLSLAFPSCVIDDADLSESLRTSWDIAPGNLLKLFGITLFVLLLSFRFALVAVFGGRTDISSVLIAVVLTTLIFLIVKLSYARVYLENKPTPEDESTAGYS